MGLLGPFLPSGEQGVGAMKNFHGFLLGGQLDGLLPLLVALL